MAQHMALVEATAATLTAIAPEHLEKLIDLPTVAREEAIALRAVAARGGTVGIALDDPWVAHLATDIQSGRKLTYSLAGPADVRATYRERAGTLLVQGAGFEGEFALPLPGRHNAGNLLAALAMASALGLTGEEMQKGLAAFRGAEGRSELKHLPDGTPVVCDYYNASPASMESGLAMLSDVARRHGSARRFACLGDMLELGPEELAFHRGLAPALERFGVREVLLYGPRMRSLRDELLARGFAGSVTHADSHAELARRLRERLAPGDAVLIKGSRGMKMEEIWKAIAPTSES
jgi:UDP-N-acetylmuramyl pentapeptide synthase